MAEKLVSGKGNPRTALAAVCKHSWSVLFLLTPSVCFWQTSGFALALGNIVHGLSVCGHGKAEDLGNKLLPAWIRTVLAEVEVTACVGSYFCIKGKGLLNWTGRRCCSGIELNNERTGNSKWKRNVSFPTLIMMHPVNYDSFFWTGYLVSVLTLKQPCGFEK